MNYCRAAALSVIMTLAVCGSAFGQMIEVSGRVTSQAGLPLPGVTVRLRGTDTATTTDVEGRYSLAVPSDGVVVFTLTGYRGIGETIRGRTIIDVTLEPAVAVLPETLVTGYTTQRRADITGAVATINVTGLSRQASTSVLQRLEALVPGVTVENGGSPGSRTTVRIRGVTSFHDNDPLYVIDGTPVQESYLNWLNPDDIEAIQVLKDAATASIYGSRGGNGVVVIETKRGRPGPRRATLDVRTGVATPVRGYDDFLILDALEYFEVVKAAYRNAGLNVPTNIYGNDTLGNNPAVPAYIWPNNCGTTPCTNVDTATYSYPDSLIMPGSPGTNWWDAVFGTGRYADANLAISGVGADNAYHASFNYFDQEGTAAYNRRQRGSARVNTSFTTGRLTVGEHLAASRERGYGGLDDNALGENNIIGKNMLQQPVVPIYDVGGNFASGKASGLGNMTNPLKVAYFGKDNVTTNDRVFGNAFAVLDAGRGFALKTQFGIDGARTSFSGFSPITPENSEPLMVEVTTERDGRATDWTWTNTLTYSRTTGRHHVSALLGHEENRSNTESEERSCANLLDPPGTPCDPSGPNANFGSVGAKWALLSFFGKADYNYADRYHASVTLRRDGSEKFATGRRWGTFPGFSIGWRASREAFLEGKTPFSDLMLRFGWGITGAHPIPSARIFNGSGGGETFSRWEENRTMNFGVDLAILDGRGTLNLDVYRREADSLWLAPTVAHAGKVRNTGIDVSLGYLETIGTTVLSVTFNGSHYRNTILRIDDLGTGVFFGPISLRDQTPVINSIGHPIGAFYGLVAEGFYLDSLDAAPYWAYGARPGRIKFRDVDNDGAITAADRTVIGSPHPDFVAGFDLGLRRGRWNLDITLFGTFGNDIFNAQKYWYVFRNFNTNVRRDLSANSAVLDGPCSGSACPGRVTNPNATYPRLDVTDAFSRQFSSYWVEDGSYVRLRSIQVGYDLPPAFVRWIPAARIYLRAENLFTITGYSGPDPALPAWDVQAAGLDLRDQVRGVDGGSYPANRMLSIGIMSTF
ncbi:MAG: SusC/RagA family TonB-linked outer membrane protein [Gemmatimonadota bacterium]